MKIYISQKKLRLLVYVAPVYNYAIAQGEKFGIYTIDKTQMHGTGTPQDLDKYIELKKGMLV